MPTGPEIILTLKILVAAVTVLFVAAIVAIASGRQKLHGQINTVFFALTMLTVVGFEILLQFVDVKAALDTASLEALRIHLCFSIPSAIVLPVMFLTGKTHMRRLHLGLGALFTLLWLGTFITGVFFLPHR